MKRTIATFFVAATAAVTLSLGESATADDGAPSAVVTPQTPCVGCW